MRAVKTWLPVALAALALAPPAGAAIGNEPSHRWVTDGPVYAVAATQHEVYVGGAFTLIGRETGSWVGISASGAVDALPPLVSARVDDAVPDGRRGWFLLVGADDDAWRVVHVRADHTLDPTWHLAVAGEVDAIDVHGDTLYLGGTFTKVNGAARLRLAAISIATRKLLPWHPEATAKKRRDGAMVNLLEASPDGSTLFIAGDFATVDGAPRAGYAALDTATGKVTQWRPTVDGDVYDMVARGALVYLCGDFAHVDGRARTELAAVTAGTGELTSWDPQPNGAVNTVVPSAGGATVYIGGSFTSAGGKSRRGAAEVDARSGVATTWDPNVAGEVDAILVAGRTVYLGGRFDGIADLDRANLAAVDARSALPTAWDPRTDREVDVLAAGTNGRVLAGGPFHTVGATARFGLAALAPDGASVLPWVPPVAGTIRALAVDPRTGSVVFGGRYRLTGQAVQYSLGVIGPGFVVQPWAGQLNALVSAIALAPDGSAYVGGAFTNVQGVARKRLALIAPNGALASWNAGANALVSSLVLDGDQLYVGGNFTSIGGATRRGLAVLDTGNGLATGWDAALDGNVRALALSNGVLYVGGSFENVGIRARNYLAAVAPETALPTDWDPDPDEPVDGLCLDPGATQLFAVGEFASMGRATRDAALFDTRAGFLLGWRPDAHVYGYACATSPDGSTVYLGGDTLFAVFG